MAIIRCDKGHYYDNTKFSQCPHCGVLPILEQEQTQEKKETAKPKRFSFFGKDKRAKTPVQPKAPEQPKTPVYDQGSGHADIAAYEEELDHTMAMGVPAAPGDDEDDDHTMAMGQSQSFYDEDDDHTIAISVHTQTPVYDNGGDIKAASSTVQPAAFEDDDDDHTIAIPKPQTSVYDDDDDHTIAIPKPQTPVHRDDDDDHTIAIPRPQPRAYDDDDDHTIAIPKPQPPAYDDDDDHTIAIPKPQVPELSKDPVSAGEGSGFGGSGFPAPHEPEVVSPQAPDVKAHKAPASMTSQAHAAEEVKMQEKARPAEPVAGWLVCTEGPERGYDYRLFKGFNRLGGGDSLDISVKDPKLGEAAVLAVVYDDRNNEFFAVQQAGGEALLNGAKLEKAVKLSSGDLLKAGESEFEFVAFCREGRTWNANE